MARKKPKAGTLTVDFKGVRSKVLLPEGEYPVEVKGVEQKESKSGNDMLEWQFTTKDCAEEAHNGSTLYYYTVLEAKSLWSLRGLLEALGEDVPDGPMDLDFDELEGAECIAVVEHSKFEGKINARMSDYMAKDSDSSGSDDDDEKVEVEDSKGGKLKKLTEDQLSEMDDDDLEELVKKYDLDVDLSSRKLRTSAKKLKAIIAAMREDDHLEEEDD